MDGPQSELGLERAEGFLDLGKRPIGAHDPLVVPVGQVAAQLIVASCSVAHIVGFLGRVGDVNSIGVLGILDDRNAVLVGDAAEALLDPSDALEDGLMALLAARHGQPFAQTHERLFQAQAMGVID